jgi:Cell division protein FtsI/penicillin-binding protein 2
MKSQSNTMRTTIAWLAWLIGAGLLVWGLFLPDTTLWRLILLTGLFLLSLVPRTYIAAWPQQEQRTLLRVSLVMSLAFLAVALQLVRGQFTYAGPIREQVLAYIQPSANERPDSATDVRLADREALGSGKVWPVKLEQPIRGSISDRSGTVLATDQNGKRLYLNGELAHIIGFDSRLYGKTGIEASYDYYLSGDYSISPSDLLRARLLGTQIPAPQAADLQLSLDMRIQQVAQEALGNRRGAVVVIEVQTGAIVAMVSYPRFDANQLILPPDASQADLEAVQAAYAQIIGNSESPLLNRAAQGRYPPGSVIKTFTAAAALDTGVMASPKAPITCPNRLRVEENTPLVRNSVENLSARTGNPSDLERVFAFSCNTAFAQIGLSLGANNLLEYAQRFGLGLVERPLEPMLREITTEAGTIANEASFLDRPAALADTAYGQGQALVTPLDMAQMVALIGNNGVMMRPYLVERVTAAGEILYQAQPEALRQSISPQAAQAMIEVLRRSVEIGYAKDIALPNISVGAKTGTAETPSGRPHAWFVALAPLEQPRYAIAVIIENGGEGSVSALPVAKRVLASAFGVTP